MREDFALAHLPESHRKGTTQVVLVVVGIVTAFFFPTIGGQFLQAYGATATWLGLIIGIGVMAGLALIIGSAASKAGLTSDLLTRGCGYGFFGSAITSIIYAFTFVIYAGLEGQILASALHSVWHIPIGIYYVVVGLLFIPLTWYGMTQMARMMFVTLPIYVILLALAIYRVSTTTGMPDGIFTSPSVSGIGGVLALLGVLSSLSGTIGLTPLEFADYNRFLPAKTFKRTSWFAVVLPSALIALVAVPMGMYFTLSTGEVDPGVYFVGILGPGLGALLAWISQMNINMTNVYSGSLAFSNVFSRIFGFNPGRVVWVGLTCILSIGLMFGDVLNNILSFLTWNGIFLLSWVGGVVFDLLVVKRILKIGPAHIEYESSKLRAINPVGMISLAAGVIVGSLMFFADNDYVSSLAPYIAFVVAGIVHVVAAVATKGKYYYPGAAVQDPSAPLIDR
jgi:purine-cytosine permease-like protein